MPMLKDMTDKIGLDLSTIDAIAVAKGPGSFTGLRIGSATAKGLALALDKPIIPIPTVDGLAYNLYGNEKIIRSTQESIPSDQAPLRRRTSSRALICV